MIEVRGALGYRDPWQCTDENDAEQVEGKSNLWRAVGRSVDIMGRDNPRRASGRKSVPGSNCQ